VPLLRVEVADVGTNDLGYLGAGEQQDSYQRRVAGALWAWRGVGRVNERKGLVPG